MHLVLSRLLFFVNKNDSKKNFSFFSYKTTNLKRQASLDLVDELSIFAFLPEDVHFHGIVRGAQPAQLVVPLPILIHVSLNFLPGKIFPFSPEN